MPWRVVATFRWSNPAPPTPEVLSGETPSFAAREPMPGDRLIDRSDDDHLHATITMHANSTITAIYEFDGEYARVHPEALDEEHLRLWHGILVAKIFDDGDIVLDDEGLRNSLRWKGLRKKPTRLRRTGERRERR